MRSTKAVYRIIAVFMAALLLTTSVGLAIDMHFCSGQLKSLTLLGTAKSCHDIVEAKSAKACQHQMDAPEETQVCSMDKKDCCENRFLHIQADQDQQLADTGIHLTKPLKQFLVTYFLVFGQNNLLPTEEKATYAHYRPPLISRDIPVLHQAFLL